MHKIHYSLENFRGASGLGHHVLYIASDSGKGKTFAIGRKTAKVFPLESFAVYGIVNRILCKSTCDIYLLCNCDAFCDPSNEMRCQLQPKKTKVRLY